MMIDVSEAAQLGTVKGEDLRAEEALKEKQREKEERSSSASKSRRRPDSGNCANKKLRRSASRR